MPVSLFPRFGRINFFGILLPGFYMLVSITVAVLACSSDATTWGRQTSSWADAEFMAWPMLTLLALFASYLLGNIPRAFVVGPTDALCNWPCRLLRKLAKATGIRLDSWKTVVRNAVSFPYLPVLRRSRDDLEKFEPQAAKIVSLAAEDNPGTVVVFDYWKHILAMHAPAAVAIAELHEGRVRFFVGMFWAGFLGVVCGVVTVICNATPLGWGGTGVLLVVVSACISVLFGIRLRFVRAEEATQVFLAYVAHRASVRNGRWRWKAPMW